MLKGRSTKKVEKYWSRGRVLVSAISEELAVTDKSDTIKGYDEMGLVDHDIQVLF